MPANKGPCIGLDLKDLSKATHYSTRTWHSGKVDDIRTS